MEIKNLIEITPEIEAAIRELFEASEKLNELVGKNGYTHSEDKITIYDRYEYSRDGLGTKLGFFAHRFYADGKVVLDFIPENNEEGKKFGEEFNKEFHKEVLDD